MVYVWYLPQLKKEFLDTVVLHSLVGIGLEAHWAIKYVLIGASHVKRQMRVTVQEISILEWYKCMSASVLDRQPGARYRLGRNRKARCAHYFSGFVVCFSEVWNCSHILGYQITLYELKVLCNKLPASNGEYIRKYGLRCDLENEIDGQIRCSINLWCKHWLYQFEVLVCDTYNALAAVLHLLQWSRDIHGDKQASFKCSNCLQLLCIYGLISVSMAMAEAYFASVLVI